MAIVYNHFKSFWWASFIYIDLCVDIGEVGLRFWEEMRADCELDVYLYAYGEFFAGWGTYAPLSAKG